MGTVFNRIPGLGKNADKATRMLFDAGINAKDVTPNSFNFLTKRNMLIAAGGTAALIAGINTMMDDDK